VTVSSIVRTPNAPYKKSRIRIARHERTQNHGAEAGRAFHRHDIDMPPIQILDLENPHRLVKARHGWFLANPKDVYLGRALLNYGEYSEMEWQLLEQLLRPGLDAVEIGANIGSHTVPMARRLAALKRRLLVVEAQPVIFQSLCANIALNGFSNVLAENLACTDRPGTLTFSPPDYHGEFNFGGVAMRQDGGGSQSVRAARLDDIIPPGFLPGLIKIDVEGFERKVLEGAGATIARHRPIIYLENDRREHSRALIEHLWAANYTCYWHTPYLFNPANFAGKSENIYPTIASINMLALPKEAPLSAGCNGPITDSSEYPATRG
jgi:FkbM family methyltransferase